MNSPPAHMPFSRILFWTAAWLLCSCGTAFSGAEVQKKVLLLYEARSDSLGNVVVDRVFRTILNEKFDVDLDIRSEYLQFTPLTKQEYQPLSSWLHRKYSGTTFDVVVAVGTTALDFVHEYHRNLFHGAQIVYWGRRRGLDNWRSDTPITGVVAPDMTEHMKSTVAFIRQLQPDLECLVVVSGTSSDDRDWEKAARQELRQFEDPIAVVYLSGLPLDDLEKRVANLRGKTAILVLTMSQDGAGRRLARTDVLSRVLERATVPMYTTSALYIDTGVVGGAMVNQEMMTVEAAGLVARLLQGESIREMPVRDSTIVAMVNWKAMRRWGIQEERLLPGTVVMYKDQSIWNLYGWYIAGVVFLCIVEGILIVALLVQRARRRGAEKTMRESQRLLQSAIDALDARIALLDENGTIITVNQPWKSYAEAGCCGAGNGSGSNYLEMSATNTQCEEARVVSGGIKDLLSRDLRDFRCLYPSARTDKTLWFQVRVKRFNSDGGLRLVVAHEDVTEIKQAHDAQQQLTGLLLRAQDEERRRIARDLHDVTVQNMVVLKADLTRVQKGTQNGWTGAVETLGESLLLCDQVIKELRTLSYLLHPPFLDEAGLLPALQWFVRGFIQRSGIQVELVVLGDIGRLAPDVETALFRVVQESLTNIHRHSGSSNAIIWVTKEKDTVLVRVTDEGHGFSLPATPDNHEAALSAGVGILGMRQRLRQLGGELDIESSSEGTTVNARISISEGGYAAYSNSR
jgi:two-component system NarL family sensor kinase